MVSQRDRTTASRNRLVTAAAAEFAARGFAGAKVDRIASKARLNKAMIYYHFRDKAELYREVLAGVFRAIANAVESGVAEGPPDARLRQFIEALAGIVSTQPHFAAMWLREMADGGAHIDEVIVAELRRVLAVLDGIIEYGQQVGQFNAANPLVTQLGIVAPLLLFAASAPARERMVARGILIATPDREELVRHIEAAALGALRHRHSRTRANSPSGAPARRQRQ